MNLSFTPAIPTYLIAAFATVTIILCIYGLIKNRHARQKTLSWSLRLGVAVLMSLLLLRPAIPTVAEIERLGTQIDLVFVVDTTTSMAVTDVDGFSRLDVAKRAIYNLAEANNGARYSLMTFGAATKTELPLTYDISALKSGLSTMSPELYIATNQGTTTTQPAELLETTMEAQQEQFPERSRLIYYITDGENTSEENFDLTAVAPLIDGGAVVGVGTTEGGPVPMLQLDYNTLETVSNGYIEGSNSALDKEQIAAIASQLGLPEAYLNTSTSELPPVVVQAVDTVIKQVDKKSPAVFEFYWAISILILALMALDVIKLARQSREVYERSNLV